MKHELVSKKRQLVIIVTFSRDDGEVSDEEFQSYAPPTQKRHSPPPHRDRRRPAHIDRGDRSRQNREQRRFQAPIKPDHAINPNKWTKYDLTNDGTKGLRRSGMSTDQVNKYAAFEFLKKQKELRKEKSDGEDEREEETGGKMLFKKPAKKESVRGGEIEKRSGALGGGAGVSVMPEYVVGRRNNEEEEDKGRRGRKQLLVLGGRLDKKEEVKEVREKVREKKGGHGISLSHLEEEEDEEGE